jgi:hypothetical protein
MRFLAKRSGCQARAATQRPPCYLISPTKGQKEKQSGDRNTLSRFVFFSISNQSNYQNLQVLAYFKYFRGGC